MHHTQLLDLVRQQVRDSFLVQRSHKLDDWCETILIRDGNYCGRCFSCENGRATWFFDENVIKIYGADGVFVSSHTTDSLTQQHSAAA